MLSKEHNNLLTKTGPGTPMGELIRRYWVPALLSEEIPKPDCAPAQVRLLGEELAAFRDSQGRIGLVDEHCAHRGTSLYYGRNEECGLRCIYHGWKFDVEGNVVDAPAEPPPSDFKKKIHITAYPTREAAGIVFAYLGPNSKMPLFPNYEWTQVPQTHTYVTKCLQECNYLQGLEGECDSSHLSFLHRFFSKDGGQPLYFQDSAPAYEVEETDFGVRMVATRKTGPDQHYVRVSSFVMPVAGCVPARDDGFEIHMFVPADDAHSWRYDLGFKRSGPVQEEEKTDRRSKQIQQGYEKIRNIHNHYLQDREAQRTKNFTGIEGFLGHDSCATETMGPIYDRSQEHLGASDKAVIAVRKFLLSSVKTLQEGKEPPHIVTDPAKNRFPDIDAIAQLIPAEKHWRQCFQHLARET
jgi:phenylpropionate dioxygenase-like ring-hydroxylating dioxygenase large terminal subunit